MPNMANVTIKAANGTTDVVLVAKVPSAGDKSPAKWTVDTAAAIREHRPSATLMSQDNGNRTARKMSIVSRFPVVRTINGVLTVVATVPCSIDIPMPNGLTDTEAAEAIAFHVNFAASTLAKECMKEGYAPS